MDGEEYNKSFQYINERTQGRIQEGGSGRTSPPKIGKNIIFWRKTVIFHTKYSKNCRASLRSAQYF
jgi:hypothetical protein